MLYRGLYCLMRLFSRASASLLLSTSMIVDVPRLRDQRARFDVREPIFVEVAADARTEAFRLSDVDDFAVSILVQIHSGRRGKLRNLMTEFFARVHEQQEGRGSGANHRTRMQDILLV